MFRIRTVKVSACVARSFSASSTHHAVGFIGRNMQLQLMRHYYNHRCEHSGLGNMGKGMAANLVTKGHSLVVNDVNAAAVSELGRGDIMNLRFIISIFPQ